MQCGSRNQIVAGWQSQRFAPPQRVVAGGSLRPFEIDDASNQQSIGRGLQIRLFQNHWYRELMLKTCRRMEPVEYLNGWIEFHAGEFWQISNSQTIEMPHAHCKSRW